MVLANFLNSRDNDKHFKLKDVFYLYLLVVFVFVTGVVVVVTVPLLAATTG